MLAGAFTRRLSVFRPRFPYRHLLAGFVHANEKPVLRAIGRSARIAAMNAPTDPNCAYCAEGAPIDAATELDIVGSDVEAILRAAEAVIDKVRP